MHSLFRRRPVRFPFDLATIGRCVGLAMALAVPATPQAGDLAALAPDDVGLCVQVTNLDRHVDAALASPLLNHLEQLEFFREFEVTANLRKLLGIATRLGAQVGQRPDEVRRKLFGGDLLLAVWPSLPMGDVLGRGLLMFETSDAELLMKLQDSLADAQAGADPDMEIRQPMHAGRAYVMREVEHDGATHSLCFAALDRLAIITGDEALLKRALELHAQPAGATGSLAQSQAYRQSRARAKAGAPFQWFVQTRSWDDLVRQQTSRLAPGQPLLGAALWEIWQKSDYWLINLDPGTLFFIDAFIACRHAELPAPLSTFAASLRGECSFFERVPSDALVAVAAHGDLKRAQQWLRSGPIREALGGADPLVAPRREVGRQLQDIANGFFVGLELFEPLLSGLGPNLGGYLLAPPRTGGAPASAADSTQTPGLQWLFSVQAGEEPMADVLDLKNNLDIGLSAALQWVANLPGQTNSPGAARVRREEINGVEVTALEGARALPPGVVAAYAIADDYLLAGTSSPGVAAAAYPDSAKSLASSSRWRQLTGSPEVVWGQQLYVDCRGLRSMAGERRQELAQMVSLWRRLRPETASLALDELLWLLEPLNALAVTMRVDDQGVSLRLAAELTAQPGTAAQPK